MTLPSYYHFKEVSTSRSTEDEIKVGAKLIKHSMALFSIFGKDFFRGKGTEVYESEENCYYLLEQASRVDPQDRESRKMVAEMQRAVDAIARYKSEHGLD